jgi:hypothetical protein
VAEPSDDVRDGPYVHPKGPYEHIEAAAGRPETMMWTFERADGGRGFGLPAVTSTRIGAMIITVK